MDKIISLLGSGWKGYLGGVVLLLGAAGLAADWLGQFIGFDVYPDHSTTWPEVALMFGNALAALGIRHKQDVAQKATVQAQEAMVETQEEIQEDMENIPHKKGTK